MSEEPLLLLNNNLLSQSDTENLTGGGDEGGGAGEVSALLALALEVGVGAMEAGETLVDTEGTIVGGHTLRLTMVNAEAEILKAYLSKQLAVHPFLYSLWRKTKNVIDKIKDILGGGGMYAFRGLVNAAYDLIYIHAQASAAYSGDGTVDTDEADSLAEIVAAAAVLAPRSGAEGGIEGGTVGALGHQAQTTDNRPLWFQALVAKQQSEGLRQKAYAAMDRAKGAWRLNDRFWLGADKIAPGVVREAMEAVTAYAAAMEFVARLWEQYGGNDKARTGSSLVAYIWQVRARIWREKTRMAGRTVPDIFHIPAPLL